MLGSISVTKKETGRPLKFYEASLFQFINPKAWTVAIAAVSGFFPTDENFFVATMFLAVTAPFVCIPSIKFQRDRKSTRLNSSHPSRYRMPSSA